MNTDVDVTSSALSDAVDIGIDAGKSDTIDLGMYSTIKCRGRWCQYAAVYFA